MSVASFDKANLRRVTISTILGSVIEWYDFFLYGVVAGLFFNKLYFPSVDPRLGTILAFATFAIGFVARPLGGIIFGHFGDKLGRKKMLILTLQIMGVSTVAIGFIPTYAQIGIFAPMLLIFCRLAQGIGLGGEWGGGVLMTFESAPQGYRCFYASLPQIGMSLGLMLATGVIGLMSSTLSEESFLAWGWRLAFILSVVMLVVGHYMRTKVHETADFTKAKNEQPAVKVPLLSIFKHYPKMIFACMGARFIDGVNFNVLGVYSLNYLTQTQNVPRTQALIGVMIAAAIQSFIIPFWGKMADRHGKHRVFGIAALMAGLSAYPAFWILHNHSDNIYLVWLAIALPFGFIHSAIFGVLASLFSDSFEANVRYTGISFVYQFSGIFSAGLTPILATYLTGWNDGAPWYLCGYLLAVGVISSMSARWMANIIRGRGDNAERPEVVDQPLPQEA